jgi:hypothetical protein
MTLYFCLDIRGGMAFNHRRQSRDWAVLADIRSRLEGNLHIDPISRRLMETVEIPFCYAPAEITEGMEAFHFFVEDRIPGDWVGFASTVVLYHWNRHYPADQFFTIDLPAMGFALAERVDFPGTSHETITREVYVK